ncbi:MAG: ArnT family glycosyltransferase [Myxococcota bacterium]
MKKSPRQNNPPDRNSARSAFVGLLIAASLLFGLGLGGTDLWAPDEPRYGAIAEEMRSGRHGAEGWVLLHLNDAPYTQKPPLYFWFAAALGAPLGRVTEVAARLPSVLAGIFCVGLTARIARRLGAHPRAALLAAALLATSFRFIFTARRAQLDVLLTAFELIAVALFVAAEFRASDDGQPDAPPTLQIAGIHAAMGAAALVKGPVGWLPLLIMAAYLGWQGRIRCFRRYSPAWALLLSFGPLLIWISGAIALAPPGFAEIAVGENVFGRFFSGTSHVRPFYYFLFQLPLDFLPWAFFLPFAIPVLWNRARTSPAEPSAHATSAARFLACWALVPLIFFTLSAGKRGVYLLPIFPALSMICLYAAPGYAASGIWPLAEPARNWARRSFVCVAVIALIELAGFAFGLPLLQAEKSPRPIAEGIARQAGPLETVGVYGLTPIEGGLAYYGGLRTESLRSEPQLATFLDGGEDGSRTSDAGRLVLLRARHFEALAPRFGLRRIAAFRKGRRQLILAEPRPNSQGDHISTLEPPS